VKQGTSSRKTARQQDQRLRRDLREERREMEERALRQSVPRRDDGPPPRID